MAVGKRKASAGDASIRPAEVAKQIKTLLKEIPEIRADASRLDELRRVFTRLEAAGELIFSPTGDDSSRSKKDKHTVAAKWASFLHKSHGDMVNQLCERVKLGRHASIRCLWGVIAASPRTSVVTTQLCSKSQSSYKYVNVNILKRWMWAVVQQESTEMDKGMRHMIEAEFFGPYRDVQYFSLGAITKIATEVYDGKYSDGSVDADTSDNENDNDDRKTRIAGKLLELLMMIPVPMSDEDLNGRKQFLFPPPENVSPSYTIDINDHVSDDDSDDDDGTADSEDESSSDESVASNSETPASERPPKRQKKDDTRKFAFQQMRMFRREYKKAWLAVLRLPLPVPSLKKALHVLPKSVLNYVAEPLRFADFFTQAYSDHGSGIIGVLALDGIFLLITKYGLEYENFYTQLYKLVSSRVMYAKYRARFYDLLSKCLLLNAMLPAHLVAAFIKRLCRCCLSGPPSSALFVLALTSNLLKKHPECICLVQRKDGTEMEDSFNGKEDDPVECRALQSSLWELAVLEKHYHPAVATLAKSIGRAEEDKAPLYNVEEFSNHTYASLFDQEKKKKTKTALTFKKPSSLFTDNDMFAGCLKTGAN